MKNKELGPAVNLIARRGNEAALDAVRELLVGDWFNAQRLGRDEGMRMIELQSLRDRNLVRVQMRVGQLYALMEPALTREDRRAYLYELGSALEVRQLPEKESFSPLRLLHASEQTIAQLPHAHSNEMIGWLADIFHYRTIESIRLGVVNPDGTHAYLKREDAPQVLQLRNKTLSGLQWIWTGLIGTRPKVLGGFDL